MKTPGQTLVRVLKDARMSQRELAGRTGYTPKHINQLVKDKATITAEAAIRFEYVFPIRAHHWLKLSMDYELRLARGKRRKR